MLETSRVWWGVCAAFGLAACATPDAPPVSAPPAPPAAAAQPQRDENALAEEARAMLAQAETDIQRARSRRALWLKAWESLVLARQAAQARDNAGTVRHANRASELAQLGLEQLAYPAVK